MHAVRNRAFLPGPAGMWDGEWVVVAATPITCHDIELWPYSVNMLVKWVASPGTLHWPQGRVGFGVGSVSFVEVLTLYELWAGERLDLENAVPRYRRAGRSISVSVVPWRSCRYIGALFRVLVALPGMFVGSFLVRLVLITVGFGTLGGKGLVMASPPGLVNQLRRVFFFNELPVLFGCPCGSVAASVTCPCALRQSTEASGRISFFHVKSGLRAPRAVLTLFLQTVSGSHRVRQSTLLLEEFHIFSS